MLRCAHCIVVQRQIVMSVFATLMWQVVAKKSADEDEGNQDDDKKDKEKAESGVEFLKKEFLAFEKRHGDRHAIEEVLVSQKRAQYEKVKCSNVIVLSFLPQTSHRYL